MADYVERSEAPLNNGALKRGGEKRGRGRRDGVQAMTVAAQWRRSAGETPALRWSWEAWAW